MPRISSFRFEQQVAFLIGFLCLVLVGTLLSGTIWISRRQSVELISKSMTELAGNMASSLDTTMFERFREIRVISDIKPLQSAWSSDPDTVRHVLDMLKASLPDYSWIGFAAPDGIVRASTSGVLEGQSVAERPWFKQGLLGPSVNDVHEAKLLSSYLESKPGAEPFRFVDVSMPVFDETHKIVGVLGAHLSWTWAEDVRRRMLASSGSEGTEVWILSSTGKMLLGPEFGSAPFDTQRLQSFATQRRGVFEDFNRKDPVLTGFTMTSGFRDYPGLGWIVVARQPVNVAFKPVETMVRNTLLLGIAVAVIGIVLAWMIARSISIPLREMTRAASLIGRDPTITMLPRLGGSKEFVELSAALRSLLRRIGFAEQQLQDAEAQADLRATTLKAEILTLQHAADTDVLTGLLNRRAFLIHAEDAMSYFVRYGRGITILVVDIDFFKRVNDRFGHPAGDVVIRRIGEILGNAVRTTDKVARFGGEEFVILLREITVDDSLVLADRICATVRSNLFQTEKDNFRVTVSIGAAVAADADRDLQVLIERADQALYDAKHRGRDCVVFDGLQNSPGQVA